jgi:hypothetical protein
MAGKEKKLNLGIFIRDYEGKPKKLLYIPRLDRSDTENLSPNRGKRKIVYFFVSVFWGRRVGDMAEW